MPKKFRLGRHVKNEERKKRAAKQVLKSAERVVPTDSEYLVVSISLKTYYETPAHTLETLKRRLEAMDGVPNGNLLPKVYASLLQCTCTVQCCLCVCLMNVFYVLF